MGKKTAKKKLENSSSDAKPTHVVTEAKSTQIKDSTSIVMKEVGILMQELEELVQKGRNDITTDEEKEKIFQRLLICYKQIALKNKVDSKREELLTNEVQEVERKALEGQSELHSLKSSLSETEAKIAQLEKLSQLLSTKNKTLESVATENIKAERNVRLQMSYDFSNKIKEISNKLDVLGKKREEIINENTRLKQVLKKCLDEYDKEQLLEEEKEKARNNYKQKTESEESEAEEETEKNSETTKEKPSKQPFHFSGNPEEIAYALMNDKDLVTLENALRDENKLMLSEDLLMKYHSRKQREYFLKEKISNFMAIFDSFQTRLNESNNLFKLKQNKVDDLTKEVKVKERAIQESQVHIQQCYQTATVMTENVQQLELEKEKMVKFVNKQKSLIDKFSEDLLAIDLIMKKQEGQSNNTVGTTTDVGDDEEIQTKAK
jgi:chromosome segregation protein